MATFARRLAGVVTLEPDTVLATAGESKRIN